MYGSISTPRGADNDQTTQDSSLRSPAVQVHNNSWIVSLRMYLVFTGVALVGALSSLSPSSNQKTTISSALLAHPKSHHEPPLISNRAQGLEAIRDDLEVFAKGAADPYHPTKNPEGYLVMLVAENKLMWKEMAAKIEEIQQTTPLPEWIFNYGDMNGEERFKATQARMMQRWINAPLDPEYLRFQAGASSVLDQLSFLLTDPNDGVLVPGPGYPAFVGDFKMYGSAIVHVAHTKASNRYVPTIDELEESFKKSMKAGNPPKILVICQPNNPTGTVYTRNEMKTMIEWALSKGLHVVSDEIYALSTMPGYTTTSAADVMRELHPSADENSYLGDYVHIVAGLSKDWGMSGFRVGSLFTHNQELLRTFDMVGFYQAVSFYTQHAITGVFADQEFVDQYINENRKRLNETYQALEEALNLVDVPLFPAEGTIFAWTDFSQFLKEKQTEKELWMELFEDAKIALTTGESCFGDKPGMFRIVYTWPEGGPEAMREFGRRLVQWKASRN